MNSRRIILAMLVTALRLPWNALAQPSEPAVPMLVVTSSLDLNGNNIRIDSYDSSDPAKSTSGQYDPAKAQDHGDIGSQYGVLSIGNSKIKGRIHIGPTNNVLNSPNGSVGDAAWVDGGMKGIKPGWIVNDMTKTFDDVGTPYTSGLAPAPAIIGGTLYDYALGNGDYYVNGSINGRMIVIPEAHATLYVTGSAVITTLNIQPGARLQLFVAGPNLSFSAVSTDADPSRLQVFGLPTLASIGTGSISALIYAPSASMTINGGGTNVAEFQGAIVLKALNANGLVNFHLDESLVRKKVIHPTLSIVLSDGAIVVSWPTSSFTFRLQQTSDLTTTNWSTVSNIVNVVGDQNLVILSPSASNSFFRLVYP